jgi:hypothetical protein
MSPYFEKDFALSLEMTTLRIIHSNLDFLTLVQYRDRNKRRHAA